MSVFHVDQQPDDATCELILIHYNERRQICRDESPCSVSRGDANAAGRKRFDDFQRTSPNTLVWIDADRTILKVRMYVLDKIEDRHPGLLKTCGPCSNYTGIDTS